MSGKPVVLRERARRDIDEAVEHYLAEAGPTVALAFIDALEDARRQIGEQPAGGSPPMRMNWIFPACASDRSGSSRI